MTQLVELLGPIAPYGAGVVIVVLLGVAISAEIRRHRQDRHTRKLEGEKHDLETAMLKAQLHQVSDQDRTYEALQRQVEEASEQALEWWEAGQRAAERKNIEEQLVAARENLRRRRAENEDVRAAFHAAMREGAPRNDLNALQAQLRDSEALLAATENEVQELWTLLVEERRKTE